MEPVTRVDMFPERSPRGRRVRPEHAAAKDYGYLDWAVFPGDPLSQVTDQVRLQSLTCGIVRGSVPFGRTCLLDGFHLYLVTHGQLCLAWVEGTDVQPLTLHAGDVLLLPHGLNYRIQSSLDVSEDLEAPLKLVDPASPRKENEVEWLGMVCHLDSAHRNLLVGLLPHAIHLRKAGL